MFVHLISKHTHRDWLRDSVLSSNAKAYAAHLAEHGYSDHTVRGYLNSVAHFAHWLTREHVKAPPRIDPDPLQELLTRHVVPSFRAGSAGLIELWQCVGTVEL